MNKSLSDEKYAELVGLADLRGIVYSDQVEFHTVLGEIVLPRVRKKNFHCMPDWTMTVAYGKKDQLDENTRITITYKTGTRQKLAEWGKLKIIGE